MARLVANPKCLALALCCGAVTTVALSGPAAHLEGRLLPRNFKVTPEFQFYRPTIGGTAIASIATGTFGEHWHISCLPSCDMTPIEPPLAIPPWARIPNGTFTQLSFSNGGEFSAETLAVGWPMRAFMTVALMSSGSGSAIKEDVEGGWYLSNPARRAGNPIVIPYTPIWPGLLTNWAIFTAASGLLIGLATESRRFYRRRKHLCAHCAYSRKGLDTTTPCPECGHSVTAH